LSAEPKDLFGVTKKTTAIEALRPVAGFDRHDPSNAISHAGRFWAISPRNVGDHDRVSVWATSSTDGVAWHDEREAICRGPAPPIAARMAAPPSTAAGSTTGSRCMPRDGLAGCGGST
jgi:hypothetical protein